MNSILSLFSGAALGLALFCYVRLMRVNRDVIYLAQGFANLNDHVLTELKALEEYIDREIEDIRGELPSIEC